MTDTITLKDIQVSCVLGCYPEEKLAPRPVSVTLTLFTDVSTPGQSDELADALDYDTLTQQVINVAEVTHFNLVEALAETIARICLQNQRVEKVIVAVTKPHPRPSLESATVTIQRTR